MQRKGKWDSHSRGPEDNATVKVNYAAPFMLSSKKLRNKADVSKGHQSAEWGTRLSPPLVRLYMTLSVTAVSSWMLDKLPCGFCFLHEYIRWLFFLLIFLSIIWMGFAQRSAWALLSLHQCGSQPFQLLSTLSCLAHTYFTGVFSLKKALCPASTAECRQWLTISHQTRTDKWSTMLAGWGYKGRGRKESAFSPFSHLPDLYHKLQ